MMQLGMVVGRCGRVIAASRIDGPLILVQESGWVNLGRTIFLSE